jgi:predicted phosphohydrolase
MKIFAIGDLHLSLSSEKPMDVFGPEWARHDERVAAAWRELVGDEDVVIVPGDISWALRIADAAADLDWIHALPGQKIFIRGNHDLWWQGIKRLNTLYEDIVFLQNDHARLENGMFVCGSRGWELPGTDFGENDKKILARELVRLKLSLDSAVAAGAGEILAAIHFPPAVAPQYRSVFTELLEQYPVKQVVYGHLHGTAAFSKGIRGLRGGILYRLVSSDYLDFRPVEVVSE